MQDCPHVSRTLEEFYTVRCQVADMRNLYESLDEVTVKDTLEGDNMYTCSTCGKKVRAEKRFVIIFILFGFGVIFLFEIIIIFTEPASRNSPK